MMFDRRVEVMCDKKPAKVGRPMWKHGLLLALATAVAPAYALQPLVTDDTGTQGAGGQQVEFGYNSDRTKVAGDVERGASMPLAYSYGLTDTVDLSVATGYVWVNGSHGAPDSSSWESVVLGGKWRFYENENTKTSFAIKPEVALPVSSRRELAGYGSGKTSGSLTLTMTQEVAFGAIHVNAGVGEDRFRSESEIANNRYYRASVAPVWDVNSQWKLAADFGMESAKAGGKTTRSHFVEIGTIYSPREDIDLALGIIRARDNANPDATTYTATAGVAWRF